MFSICSWMSCKKRKFKIFETISVKSYDLFLWIDGLKRNFSYVTWILPFEFTESFNIFEVTPYFIFQRVGYHAIKFLYRGPEEWDFCLIPNHRNSSAIIFLRIIPCFLKKFVEIKMISILLRIFSWFLEKEENSFNYIEYV